MSEGDLDNADIGTEARLSAEHVLSALLVLALMGAVLLWSYLAPQPASLSFPTTEHPPFSSGD